MLFAIALAIALIALLTARWPTPQRLQAASLGWMSQRWLAELRASESSPF
jgi:hypothetical protein